MTMAVVSASPNESSNSDQGKQLASLKDGILSMGSSATAGVSVCVLIFATRSFVERLHQKPIKPCLTPSVTSPMSQAQS